METHTACFCLICPAFVRIECRTATEIENGTEVENDYGDGIDIDIDRYKKEGIHSTSMLAELRGLSTWASHPRERAELRLTGQLLQDK
ncbi:hypothetical protein EVAR_80726_1 [Eumeta japonica]|uniref:Uncharacterized protein n=1 Tax=Eumeta variegata TaxID=151549 RepID=A0A4C1U465_EUMVA|nr:hypothetical protein EVAR_80726_1 [Eumeta japonica]